MQVALIVHSTPNVLRSLVLLPSPQRQIRYSVVHVRLVGVTRLLGLQILDFWVLWSQKHDHLGAAIAHEGDHHVPHVVCAEWAAYYCTGDAP